jgi:hypothetical protein
MRRYFGKDFFLSPANNDTQRNNFASRSMLCMPGSGYGQTRMIIALVK